MEAVLIRQKGAVNFTSYYESLCALESICPVQQIRTSSKEEILDCSCDRLRRIDWHPLNTAIKVNKSLKEVILRMKWRQQVLSCRIDKSSKLKPSAIHEKDIRFEVVKALKSCLAVTTSLHVLRLEGIPFSKIDLGCLSKGLTKNKTLATVSFCGSMVKDEGVQIVSQALKNSLNIQWLDFTACKVTHVGALALANMIKHHSIIRHCAAWKDSLRHCSPNLTTMPGLRRLTLNLNPGVGDGGVKVIADSLNDDLWINALDLQSCGVSSEGADHLIAAVRTRKTIAVCDLRDNELIGDELLDELYELLRAPTTSSSDSNHQGPQWLPVVMDEIRASVKPSVPVGPSQLGKKTGSARSKPPSKQPPLTLHVQSSGYVMKGKGLPWRTATRKVQRWKMMSSGLKSKPHTTSSASSQFDTTSQDVSEGVSLESYKEIGARQNELLSQMRSRIIELEEDNRQLKEQVLELTSRLSAQAGGRGEDSDALDEIESSLKRFHSFLDLLQSRGLEDLCTMVGMPREKGAGVARS